MLKRLLCCLIFVCLFFTIVACQDGSSNREDTDEEIKVTSSTDLCKNCNANIPYGDSYCSQCEEKLNSEKEDPVKAFVGIYQYSFFRSRIGSD